jgi:hypothetical protein
MEEMLAAGWQVCGYSVSMMALGAVNHSVLLIRGTDMTACNIVYQGGKEMGRSQHQITPTPPVKKGWL